MKKTNIALISLILVCTMLLFCKSFVYAQVFGAGDYATYNNNSYNIPMPSDPTPPPSSYSNSSSTSTSTSTKPHKKPSIYTDAWVDQTSTDLANYILQSYKQAELKKQQAAIEAAKIAAEAKKQAEIKKKQEDAKWLQYLQNEPASVVKADKNKTKIMSLKDDDPYRPKHSSTLKGLYDTSSMSMADRAKCAAWLQNKANYSNQVFGSAGSAEANLYTSQRDLLMKGEPIDMNCSEAIQTNSIAKFNKPAADYYHPPTMSEDHIRNVYKQTVIDLKKCAAEQNCSSAHIENLKKIQIKADQELITHYGIKGN